MDKDDHPDTPRPPPPPLVPPSSPPISLPPRLPPETSIFPLNPHHVQPPPTPTLPATTTDSSPSSSHRRKRSKLTRIDLPPPPSSTTAITTTTNTEGASTPTSTTAQRPHPLAPFIIRFDPPPPPSTTAITTATNTEGASTSTSMTTQRPHPLAPFIIRFDPPPPPSSTTAITITKGVSTSRTPARKPDPSAPKITPPCTECGKSFWSKKALFGHMRCHPERQWRGINPPPHLRRSPPLPLPPPPPPPNFSEDECEVANILLLLGSFFGIGGGDDRTTIASTPARFECSSCKKTFPTHQALGGHRASHKNVKGCFAITKSGVEEEGSTSAIMEGHNYHFPGNGEMVPRLGPGMGYGLELAHMCGICSKVFTSGQALGGHMRCHGEKTEEASTSSAGQPAQARRGFDLNLPAEVEEDEGSPPPDCSTSEDTELDLRLGL